MVLRAADLYWSYPGERVFSVSANGIPALTDYDVIAEAGEAPLAAACTWSNPHHNPASPLLANPKPEKTLLACGSSIRV